MHPQELSADLDHILAHTAGLWESLRNRQIFLTGGTGFFGIWLLESFAFANAALELRAQAVVLTRSKKSFAAKASHLAANPFIKFLEGDARSFEFPAGQFSHVIHAATQTNSLTTPPEPMALFDANVQATRRVVEFARKAGVHRFLFTSSGAVYGAQPAEITHLPETYPGSPSPFDLNTAYGQSKRVSEFICTASGQECGFDAMIARCFAFVGPHLPLDANYAIGNFTRDALQGGDINIGGDGTPYRSYLYAADLMIWLWTILFCGKPRSPYNVGSDADLSIAELANVVAEVVNPQARVRFAQKADPARAPQRYVPSIDRARSELNLQPWIDLRDGIRRMANWNARQL